MTEIFDSTPEPDRKLPIIAGVEITTDAHGRFNLNALHKASGEGDHKAPNQWLRLAGTKALIAELKSQTADLQFDGQSGNSHIGLVHTTRGGNAPGTFVDELLAVDYAGWISPAFRLEVHRVFIAYRTGRAPAPTIPAATLEQIERSFGIMRAVIHKVTEIEKAMPGMVQAVVAPMIEAMVEARLAKQNLMIRHGRTAGQIWADYGLPRLKNAPTWLGNRLSRMGCQVGGNGRAEIGGRLSRVYDPDKVEFCMTNGLLQTARAYAAERAGQGRLALVGGGA